SAWNFGRTERFDNGSEYNLFINGYYYLIQENWDAYR
ncbi:unnamed protein product, partial [Rotaria sp. Silwood1]